MIVDKNRIFTEVNPKLCEILGYKKDVADVKIWSLIFGRIGISNVRKNFYSIKDVPENKDLIAFKRINSESTIISYTFGERFTLTLGTTIENKGDICIGEISKSSDELFNEYCSEKLERKYHEILYYINKIENSHYPNKMVFL